MAIKSTTDSTKTTATKKSTVTKSAVEKAPAKKTEETATGTKASLLSKVAAMKTNSKEKDSTAKKTESKPAEKVVKTSPAKKTAATSSPAEYNEDSIQHLEGLEHIRLRPGMYIGSLGDGSNENDGIYILLKEGIDNSVDEFSQGFGSKILIGIENGRVKIRDFGRGIPLGKLEDCVSNVNTGAKYNNSVFKQAIGMNGVGIKATNALSSYFRAASIRDGEMAVVEYKKGEKISSKKGPAKPGEPNGTYLEFEPDLDFFVKY